MSYLSRKNECPGHGNARVDELKSAGVNEYTNPLDPVYEFTVGGEGWL